MRQDISLRQALKYLVQFWLPDVEALGFQSSSSNNFPNEVPHL